jgi:low affinity Fe/Cu permease
MEVAIMLKSLLENLALLMQSLYYLTAIGVLIVLAIMFWQNVQAQNAAHARAEQRHEQLLYESRQALLDHQKQMERLAR